MHSVTTVPSSQEMGTETMTGKSHASEIKDILLNNPEAAEERLQTRKCFELQDNEKPTQQDLWTRQRLYLEENTPSTIINLKMCRKVGDSEKEESSPGVKNREGGTTPAPLTSSLRCSPSRRPRAGRRPLCGGAGPRAWRPRSASILCHAGAVPPRPVWPPPHPHLGRREGAVVGFTPRAQETRGPLALHAPLGLKGPGLPNGASEALLGERGIAGPSPISTKASPFSLLLSINPAPGYVEPSLAPPVKS